MKDGRVEGRRLPSPSLLFFLCLSVIVFPLNPLPLFFLCFLFVPVFLSLTFWLSLVHRFFPFFLY